MSSQLAAEDPRVSCLCVEIASRRKWSCRSCQGIGPVNRERDTRTIANTGLGLSIATAADRRGTVTLGDAPAGAYWSA